MESEMKSNEKECKRHYGHHHHGGSSEAVYGLGFHRCMCVFYRQCRYILARRTGFFESPCLACDADLCSP